MRKTLAAFIINMKNKISFISIIFLVVLFSRSKATDKPYYNFGIRAGFNFSAFESQSNNMTVNPALGISSSGYFSDIFYLNLDISYIVRSVQLNDISVMTYQSERQNPTPIYNWDYQFKISYFQFGLGVGFCLYKNFSIFGGAGISFAGYNLSQVKSRKEFVYNFYYDDRGILPQYQEYGEGTIDPIGEFTFNIGIRYDYEKFFFEINYMRDFFERGGFYSIYGINSYLGTVFFTIGYNIFYHITK